MKSTYSSSGVNIQEGDLFVEKIKPLVKSTFTKNVLSGIGNFGAFYKLPKNLKNPVFVSSTDGVGTKLKIAVSTKIYTTIGQDLVNHCVNDIAVCGAKPLFFLDYLAFGILNSAIATDIVKELVKACIENKCSLIGGETAEMPGIYDRNDFDLAGTIIGVTERNKIINKDNVRKGDILIGLKSNGLHTNGYSLVRKVLLKKYKFNDYIDILGHKLFEELLRVHKSYLNIIQRLVNNFDIHSISHITGGGIANNTERVIPKNRKMKIDWGNWEVQPIFDLIKKTGKIDDSEMRKVFNLGIGLVLVVDKADVTKISTYLYNLKEKHYIIGEIN